MRESVAPPLSFLFPYLDTSTLLKQFLCTCVLALISFTMKVKVNEGWMCVCVCVYGVCTAYRHSLCVFILIDVTSPCRLDILSCC